MNSIRRVRPLCWFLLVWFVVIYSSVIYITEQYRPTDTGPLVPFTVLLLIHLGLYWMGFSVKMRRSLHWVYLLAQAGLVLVITQLSQNGGVFLTLSIMLIVAIVDMLKQVRPILLAIAGYLVLLLLYIPPLGSKLDWYPDATFVLLTLFVLAGLLLTVQQERAHERTQALLRELEAAHTQLSAYALRVEDLTMLTERQRLARELHDTLSQGLAGLVMQLEAANSYLVKDRCAQAQEIVVQAMTRARTVLTDTRYVLHDLRADSPRPDDLPEMVQEEIDRFRAATGIPCEASLDTFSTTPDAYCAHVLRVITEGLANVARHAQARQVWVRAINREQMLDIEVRDDGIGFDPTIVAARPGHYGLIGLRERARLIGGQLTIISSPGKGTCIQVRVPGSDARSCV